MPCQCNGDLLDDDSGDARLLIEVCLLYTPLGNVGKLLGSPLDGGGRMGWLEWMSPGI